MNTSEDFTPSGPIAADPAAAPGREAPAAGPRDGLLLVDKHAGCTSHDVVAAARKILRQKRIGHCGTLDPDATGLLLLTVGNATRLTRFLIRAPKTYTGKIRFGVTTDTYDTAGEIVRERPVEGLSDAKVAAAMEGFVGELQQTPPPYCAKKINGVKYYELARRGEATPEDPKEVTVYDFHATAPFEPGRDLPFLLSCSSGTYARSLAHDVGENLGSGGTLSELRRTRIGNFRVEEALGLDALRARMAAGEPLGSCFIPFDDIELPFGEVVADAQQEKRIQHGQTVLFRELEGQEGDWVKVMNRRRQFIAVGSLVEKIGSGSVGVVQPKVVFG
jgi:tRNA pseudouridine55 synthase